MDALLEDVVRKAVWVRFSRSAPIDLALFGAAADSAEEDGDPDLAAGLRSGLCPLCSAYGGGGSGWDGLASWFRASQFASGMNSRDLDNVPDFLFEMMADQVTDGSEAPEFFPGRDVQDFCMVSYLSFRSAFRALGRAIRRAAGLGGETT